MKVLSTVLKIVAALAAIAGIVYVIATYGDKIVAWAKKLLGCCESVAESEIVEEDVVAEEPAEEAPAEAEEVQVKDEDFEG